jgi:hypothetical protein
MLAQFLGRLFIFVWPVSFGPNEWGALLCAPFFRFFKTRIFGIFSRAVPMQFLHSRLAKLRVATAE